MVQIKIFQKQMRKRQINFKNKIVFNLILNEKAKVIYIYVCVYNKNKNM